MSKIRADTSEMSCWKRSGSARRLSRLRISAQPGGRQAGVRRMQLRVQRVQHRHDLVFEQRQDQGDASD